MPVDPALTALWPQDRSSGLHGPALPDTDFRNRARSNVLSNFVSESGSTDFVNDLVRLQAEAAGNDYFLDLGGAAEVLPSQRCNRMPSATGIDASAADGSLARQLKWVADSLSAIAGG
jgi:hypothetical protein